MFVYSVEDGHPTLSAVSEPVDFVGLYRLKAEVVVGKSPLCDVRIRDEKLHDRHARIEVTVLGVFVEDLSGGGGVLINGKRRDRARLEDGDQLRFQAPSDPRPAHLRHEPSAQKFEPAPKPSVSLASDEGPAPVEISRETVPWQPVVNLENLCTDDKGKWVSSTLKLDSAGHLDKSQLRLQVLLSLSAALSRPQKLEDHLQQVAEFVLQTMNLDRSALFLVNEPVPGEPLSFRYRTQVSRGEQTQAEPSMTVMSKVVQDEQGLLIRDAMVNDGMVASQSIKIQKIRTCICLPLKTPRRMLGVLYADAARPSVLNDKEDVAFFSAFATLAAVAVENSLLLEQVQQQARNRARFERFFPPNTLDTVLGEGNRLEGREQDVTVVFCDIRNYTQMSAQRNPREVAAMLNRYFQTLVPIVFRNGGTLEKYIGDALVAIWGAPLTSPPAEQSLRACQAALEIQDAIAELNRQHQELPIEVGIGVHHGPAYVGTIGDESYLQYAAIGATTNLSARICAQTPAHEVLVSRQVAQYLHGRELKVVSRGSIAAKGFAEQVDVFQVHR